jgi:methyl-accepting chemotaxis protein
MDLDSAIQKHAEWKMKFRTAMSQHETMDAATIAKDNCCELGKWLHGEAKTKFGKLSSHSGCVTSHAAFHLEAGKVAQAINAKKYVEAENMLGNGTPYANASNVVAGAIMKLKKEAKL